MDRYNLYYAYKPSKINHHIHTSAINFVIIALIILQFNMLFYNTIRTSKSILSQYNLISPRQQCPIILCLRDKFSVKFYGRFCFVRVCLVMVKTE